MRSAVYFGASRRTRDIMTTITLDYELQSMAANAIALAAPATAPDELERLRQIAHLTGTIFCYGNFVAETHNEAVLEKLLRENGTFWDSVEQYEKSQGWIP